MRAALALIVVAACARAHAAPTDERPSPAPVADAGPPLVAWEDLQTKPLHWVGRRVRLRIQHHSRPATWNPYVTRFGPRQFSAVQAWTDDQLPWIKAQYDAPAVRVFARRGSAAEHVFAQAAVHQRFEIVGVVRELFLDLPWIEVASARALENGISEAAVIHASRAIQLVDDGLFALADLELEQVLAAPLPPHAQADIEERRKAVRAALAQRR